MRKLLIQFSFLLCINMITAQNTVFQINLDSLQPERAVDQTVAKPLYSDSLASSFIIWIKTEVPLHKHEWHTEQVLILEGEALMRVGDTSLLIQPGDMIFIPAGTPHQVKVTSTTPLKVLSIQSPEFTGNDRVLLKE